MDERGNLKIGGGKMRAEGQDRQCQDKKPEGSLQRITTTRRTAKSRGVAEKIKGKELTPLLGKPRRQQRRMTSRKLVIQQRCSAGRKAFKANQLKTRVGQS